MRVPNFEWHKRVLSGIGLFAAGAVVGCAVYTAVFHHNFSLLLAKNAKLQSGIESLQKNVDDLNKNKNKQSLVSQISVQFETRGDTGKLDEITRSELRKEVLKDLDLLRGKQTADIRKDPLLYSELVNGNKYTLSGGKTYEVEVKALIVVQNELTVWITAETSIVN